MTRNAGSLFEGSVKVAVERGPRDIYAAAAASAAVIAVIACYRLKDDIAFSSPRVSSLSEPRHVSCCV